MTKWFNKWFGKRIIKTAISVFITAAICQQLDWPAIFAVITAIVTIEPTLGTSIKKGFVRLPAAAIGTAIAMFFDFMFGQSPLTYALSASLTIYICHLLRWHDAMIVATLTAVAMIPMTEEHFLLAFFIRLGTTSVGIIVSALVNFIIMPPNFSKEIDKSYRLLLEEIKQLIGDSLDHQINRQGNKRRLTQRLAKIMKDIEKATQLIGYQREEYRYHPHSKEDLKNLMRYQHKIDSLQKISYHVGDILSLSNDESLDSEEKKVLMESWASIAERLTPDHPRKEEKSLNISAMAHKLQLILHKQTGTEHFSLTKSCSISYELLAISSILSEKRK